MPVVDHFQRTLIQIQIQIIEFKILSEHHGITTDTTGIWSIRVITKLPNSEQSYKGKVKTHNYINRQNQSTTLLFKL
jgi:hypothetical protein